MRLSDLPDGHVLRFLRFLRRAKLCVSPAFYATWWPVAEESMAARVIQGER